MYFQTTLVVTLLILGCDAFYNPLGNGRPGRQAMCSRPTKPCRIQVTLRNFNGTPAGEIGTQTCTCSHPNRCSRDWSLRSHVISRNLISMDYNMTLNMMFCQPILPRAYCTVNDEALEVVGTSAMPREIAAYNCKCRYNSPLMLHRRWIASDHLFHHSYVCSEHKPTCPNHISHCLVSHRDIAFYHCKCPARTHCRIQRTRRRPDRAHGYCRR